LKVAPLSHLAAVPGKELDPVVAEQELGEQGKQQRHCYEAKPPNTLQAINELVDCYEGESGASKKHFLCRKLEGLSLSVRLWQLMVALTASAHNPQSREEAG